MVVISVLAIENICESFTQILQMRYQGKTKFLSLMGIRKEFIANIR